jgi:hypothetical protein
LYWTRKYTMSPEYTDFSVAVVEPLPPKFSPPDNSIFSGLAAAHAGSAAPAVSTGAVATFADTSVFGSAALSCCVVQAVAASTASASAPWCSSLIVPPSGDPA